MKKILRLALILALFGAASCGTAQNPPAPKALAIACDENFAPYTFKDDLGNPAGLLVDFWNLWSQKTGRPVGFLFSNWPGTMEMVRSGRADIHSGLFWNAERAQWLDFSLPFMASTTAVFVPVGQTPYASLAALAGEKVGAIAGSESENQLKQADPPVAVAAFDEPRAMIQAARAGAIPAFADETMGTLHLLDAMGLSGRFEILEPELFSKKFRAGVLKGREALVEEIDWGIRSISFEEMDALESRWMSPEKK